MSNKKIKPTSPGRRYYIPEDFSTITKSKPEKSLLVSLKKRGGRNNSGKMTVRHRGGGHKRKLRDIDFKRLKLDIPATVRAIEYDPNRTARIALLFYADGSKSYIIAPKGLELGQVLLSTKKIEIPAEIGNSMPLSLVPVGSIIHNIELQPGKGAEICRSAGTFARLIDVHGKYARVVLPSGEERKVLATCIATIGEVGNSAHGNICLGKAGRNRWKGRRPRVRGVAMNPVDHPMGGGEGKSSGGHPRSKKGLKAKGEKRKGKNIKSKLIEKSRKK